ncbi:MAG: bifunctional precorrin-2 dehydrogenase/sirohydrochlorin ferrochelatase [Candidatus Ventricola sp.]
MKPYFPMFVPLEGRRGLVVGGGTVALRKIEKLAPYGASIRVIAPQILPEIAAMTDVERVQRAFRMSDLRANWAFVIAATDDPQENHVIAEQCDRRNIPVNVVDDPAHCSFIFPALVHHGPFSVGVSTGGASPTAAIYFKEKIEGMVPEHFEEMLMWLQAQRAALKADIPEEKDRAPVLKRLFAACMEKGAPLDDAELKALL